MPSGEKSASLTDAACPSSTRRGSSVAVSQRLTDMPRPLAARVVPSGEKTRAMCPSSPRGPMIRCSSSPVRGSQIRMLPLWAEATRRPSGANATVPTQPALLRNVTWVSGAAAGQSLTVPSRLPEAARAPSGPKATQWTKPVCPWNAAFSPPPARSQRRTLLSSLPETSWLPSGENARPRTNPRWPIKVCKLVAGSPVPEPDGLVPAAGGHAPAVR